MTESFDRRKTELEIGAKNTIVEIYLIREKREEIDKILGIKESYLRDVNAALQELEHLNMILEKEKEEGGSEPD